MAGHQTATTVGVGFEIGYTPFLKSLKQNQSKYTDFTIKKGERSWKVHKLVICAQSEYFLKACDGDFKEAKDNAITLSEEDDTGAVTAMIHFFYHFEYPTDTSEAAILPILQDIRVFVTADKYLVASLRDVALQNIRKRFIDEWNSEAFAMAIREIYGLDPIHKDMLKPEVAKIVANHKELFVENQPGYVAFQSTLKEFHEFVTDAAIAIASVEPAGGPLTSLKCPDCGEIFHVKANFQGCQCPYNTGCNSNHGFAYPVRDWAWWAQHQV